MMTRIMRVLVAFALMALTLNVVAVEIAFTRFDNNDNQKIQILREDGSISTPPGQRGMNQSPVWSPDGKLIGFSSDRNNRDEVFLINADDGRLEEILTWLDEIPGSFMGWTPGGKIWMYQDSPRVVFLVDPSTHQVLREIPVGPVGPTDWSPDGRQLIGVVTVGGERQIARINSDGTGYQQLTSIKTSPARPRWSPDGKLVAFQARPKKDGPVELFVMGADGAGITQVTDSMGDTINVAPSWIDNETLVAESGSLLKNESYILSIRIDGTGARRLVSSVVAVGYQSPVVRPQRGLAVVLHGSVLTMWGKLKSR